jgi:uncharacterized protein (DUF885 family)
MKLLAACLLAFITLLPATGAAQPDKAETARLHALFEQTWDEGARLFPEWATYRGDPRYNDRLSDASPQALAALDRRVHEILAETRTFRRELLAPADRVSLDMLIEMYQRFADEQAFPGWRTMSLGALGGAQTQFAELLQVSPNRTRAQVQQMLARIAAYPRRVQQEIDHLRLGLAAGWVPSRDVIARVLAQIDAQLPPKAEDSPYYRPFARLPREMPEAERLELQAAGQRAIEQHIYPAMRALRAFVAGDYAARAPADGALKNYPDGTRVYAMLVRHNTTTTLTPEQIHRIGVDELARLRRQMDAVMREVKFEGDFAAFARHLYTDPRFFHRSPEALLAGYREIAKRVDAELPKLFAELPRAPYGVIGMPDYMGPNRAEYYQSPAMDGSRAGYFYANLAGYKTRPIWSMETLVAHEAVPGHHLQSARAQEISGLPAFRRQAFGYVAYGEGWALYAETLGYDLGLYTDPYSRFGHLVWQAFRAARLVVDTGMHALGWSRQRCIEFMVAETGVDRDFVAAEIDRYSTQPGQALGYMIGRMKFEELRDRAKAALGARFDIRRFHNAVLDQGPLPLTTLEKIVDEWIERQRGPAAGG